jgi:phosphatidylinositol-bisphosphatase
MVGIFITVWVRNDLLPYIQHPSVSCVGCGIMGCLGNKVRTYIHTYIHTYIYTYIYIHTYIHTHTLT